MKFFKKLNLSKFPKYFGRGVLLLILYSGINLFCCQTVISGLENINISAVTKIYVTGLQENNVNDKQLKTLYISEGAVVYNKEQITVITPKTKEERISKHCIVKHNILVKSTKQQGFKEKVTKKAISPTRVFKANNEDIDSAFEVLKQTDFTISINCRPDISPKALAPKNTFTYFFIHLIYSVDTLCTRNHYWHRVTHSMFCPRPPPL